jgi:WD40 repeat protein
VTDTTVVVWQPRYWRERLRVEHDGAIEAVRVSPDGSKLATVTRWITGGHDSGLHLTRVFDLTRSNEIGWEYESGEGNISKAFMQAEAARSQRALVGGNIRLVRESQSAWQVLELNEPGERVSADRTWVVRVSGGSFSSRSVMELRDRSTSRAIARLEQPGRITGVRFVPAFTPRWLVSAGEDGTLRIWPIQTKDLADQACAQLQAILGAHALGKLIADAHAEQSCEAY